MRDIIGVKYDQKTEREGVTEAYTAWQAYLKTVSRNPHAWPRKPPYMADAHEPIISCTKKIVVGKIEEGGFIWCDSWREKNQVPRVLTIMDRSAGSTDLSVNKNYMFIF